MSNFYQGGTFSNHTTAPFGNVYWEPIVMESVPAAPLIEVDENTDIGKELLRMNKELDDFKDLVEKQKNHIGQLTGNYESAVVKVEQYDNALHRAREMEEVLIRELKETKMRLASMSANFVDYKQSHP